MSKFDPSLHVRIASTERLLPSRDFLGLLQAVLEKGADFRLKAKGKSMFPFICDGDILTIGSIKQNIELGDIVAAEQPESGQLVVHRVIALSAGKLLIKGDGNSVEDGWIEMSRIFGAVIKVERRSRIVRPGSAWVRRLVAFISRQAWLQRARYSIYRRLLYLGEVY